MSCVATAHTKEDSPTSCAVQCPLQTRAGTQPRVRYIHTTMPCASYMLHLTARFPLPPDGATHSTRKTSSGPPDSPPKQHDACTACRLA